MSTLMGQETGLIFCISSDSIDLNNKKQTNT